MKNFSQDDVIPSTARSNKQSVNRILFLVDIEVKEKLEVNKEVEKLYTVFPAVFNVFSTPAPISAPGHHIMEIFPYEK